MKNLNDLFDVLENSYLQYGVYNNERSEWYVWTPGYHHADCHIIEKNAMDLGYYCTSIKFDKMCGKTLLKFKKQGK